MTPQVRGKLADPPLCLDLQDHSVPLLDGDKSTGATPNLPHAALANRRAQESDRAAVNIT